MLAGTLNNPSNPIIMFQFFANQSGTLPNFCVLHHMRILQQTAMFPRPAAWLAANQGCASPGPTYYAPQDESCAGFTAAVGHLMSAHALTGAPTAGVLEQLFSVPSASFCCSICTNNPRCVAHQWASGTCTLIDQNILDHTSSADVAGWVSGMTTFGILYHREPAGGGGGGGGGGGACAKPGLGEDIGKCSCGRR